MYPDRLTPATLCSLPRRSLSAEPAHGLRQEHRSLALRAEVRFGEQRHRLHELQSLVCAFHAGVRARNLISVCKDGACLCISESYLAAVAECVSTACPDDLPNANAFFGSQCAVATRSLLDPRQDAGASTVPEDPATATSAFSITTPPPPPPITTPSPPPITTASPPVTPSPSVPSPSSSPSSGSTPLSTQATATPTSTPALSHKAPIAAIAGGVVGGLLFTIALIAITLWCMRGRFRFRLERVEEKQKERAIVDPDPAPLLAPAPAPAAAYADDVELRSLSTLALDRPVPPSVLATQVAMWEKASSAASLPPSSPRVPNKEHKPDVDVAALLWDDPHPHGSPRGQSSGSGSGSGTRHTPTMSVASGSAGGSSVPASSSAGGSGGSRSVRPDPATQMQLRAMAERVAQLEAAMSARGASSPPGDELPPNCTPGP
ncbi:hypothetical protein DFH09DRAFT_1094453 [Mycena vulgaris]|nr:hypothetical protein DFH09DRAFT_1094453 [Mycena vulgaris]